MAQITWHNERRLIKDCVPYSKRVCVCQTCGEEFVTKHAYKGYTPKYCSSICWANRGVSKETRKKMSEAKTGKTP